MLYLARKLAGNKETLTGADLGFFLGGGALASCSTSTPINHIVFFLQNTSLIRKPKVISGGGGGGRPPGPPPRPPHPLHPPPRSAPVLKLFTIHLSSPTLIIVMLYGVSARGVSAPKHVLTN